MDELKLQRIEFRLTNKVLKDILKYQEANGISFRSTAIVELIRKGLQQEKDEGEI